MSEGNIILRYKFHEVLTQRYYTEKIMYSVMCVCLSVLRGSLWPHMDLLKLERPPTHMGTPFPKPVQT